MTPDISIVVTIVDGGVALRNCLRALAAQVGDQTMEVLVPYDFISMETEACIDDFPEFCFINMGRIVGGQKPVNALELHRFWDVRRAAGIKAATGKLIGLLEDRGIPNPNWAKTMVDLHGKHDAAAIGGAVDNGTATIWNWAIHFCDFGRYQPPLFDENPEFLSGTNVCYRAEALADVNYRNADVFYEPKVHQALRDNGWKFLLTDAPLCIQYRPRIGTDELGLEFYHWGKYFGLNQAAQLGAGRRLVRICAATVLPFVLYLRHLRRQIGKKHHMREFLLASPLVFFIGLCWSAGEFVGYLRAKPEAVAGHA
jgi:GT2 family glycosyltransferase